jgi:hypothetical protein
LPYGIGLRQRRELLEIADQFMAANGLSAILF